MSFTRVLWGLMAVCLAASAVKDRARTKLSLVKAWKSFENILPQFGGIIILIAIMLAFLTPKTISSLLGGSSGMSGMLLTSFIGSVTLVPGFLAFPLAKSLVQLGAGVEQIAVLVSTLMMVGIVTMPLEIRYFGKKIAVARNVLAYIASFGVAAIIGAVLK